MRVIIACVLFMMCCNSCIQYRTADYASPINELNNTYTTIPLHSDSLKFAGYINSLVSVGGANDWGHDNTFSFQSSLSGANNFKHLQAFYGLGLVLGNYKMNVFDSTRNDQTVKPTILNQYSGKKFFGGIGVSGGMNVVGTFPGGGEVRAGFETSLYREFGHYLAVRKQLPDSAVTFINRSDSYCTLGGHIELVAKLKYGSLAFRSSLGTVLGSHYHVVENYMYYNNSLAFTIKRWTPYFQANFATKSNNALFGVNYRL